METRRKTVNIGKLNKLITHNLQNQKPTSTFVCRQDLRPNSANRRLAVGKSSLAMYDHSAEMKQCDSVRLRTEQEL
jgi:hypothetical protein